MTGKCTSGDSSPSITAPLVSTWMTFGVGNDVDAAILVQTVGTGHWSRLGGGAADYSLFRRMFQSRQLAFVRAPLPFPTKNETKAVPKGNKGVGRVGEMSGRMGRPLSSVDTARLSEVKYKSESPVG